MPRMATIRRPLPSKRVTISPVSPRSNASGFTRIRVRSIRLLSGRESGSAGRLRAIAGGAGGPLDVAVGRSRLARRRWTRRGRTRRRSSGGAAGPRAPAFRRDLPNLGLTVGADLPARIERLAADRAWLLQAAQAARAAEEGLLDLEAAVLARLVLEAREAGLGGGDLELPLTHVLEELGRPHDDVDDRPDEGEQRCGRRAADEHWVGDPAAGVRERPVDQRKPDHDEEQQQQVDREVQPVVIDAEDGEDAHRIGECSALPYRKSRPNA